MSAGTNFKAIVDSIKSIIKWMTERNNLRILAFLNFTFEDAMYFVQVATPAHSRIRAAFQILRLLTTGGLKSTAKSGMVVVVYR